MVLSSSSGNRLSEARIAQKPSRDNRFDSTSKRRGRRKGSKVEESPGRSIVGLKKRQINESEKVKRGQERDTPLSNLERELSHPDMHLAPTEKSPHDLVSFRTELVSELQKQVREEPKLLIVGFKHFEFNYTGL